MKWLAVVACAAVGCGYSEAEMQLMRDHAKLLESALIRLEGEFAVCQRRLTDAPRFCAGAPSAPEGRGEEQVK